MSPRYATYPGDRLICGTFDRHALSRASRLPIRSAMPCRASALVKADTVSLVTFRDDAAIRNALLTLFAAVEDGFTSPLPSFVREEFGGFRLF